MAEIMENIVENGDPSAASGEQKEEKLFTQEQVNEIVKKRLAKVKQQEGAPDPEEFTRRTAELSAKESRLSCREYLIEQNYPRELLDALDTTDVEKFKEKADILQRVYGKSKNVQPFGDQEFDGPGESTLKQAFSHSKKHTPDTSRLGY